MHLFLLYEHNATWFSSPYRHEMDLAKRFEDAAASASVNIISLILIRPYPIVCGKRINTKYRPTVLLSIRDVDEKLVDIFVPKRYHNFFSDDDLEKINSSSVYLNLCIKAFANPPDPTCWR